MKLRFDCDTSPTSATQASLNQCTRDQWDIPTNLPTGADGISLAVALFLAVVAKSSSAIPFALLGLVFSLVGMLLVLTL